MTPKELIVKIEELQSLMIDYVTNKRTEDQLSKYKRLFREIDYALNRLELKHPNSYRSLESFWLYCKENLSTYASRREYVDELYSSVSQELYDIGQNTPPSRNWKRANNVLKDDLEPVRKTWQKARNFIYDSPPDFENSIKESVNCIESCLKIKLNEPNGTLGQLIQKVNMDRDIQSLISGVYGRVSNKDFVRHGGTKDSDLGKAEAEFFLELAAISINYIKTKLK